jgi:hypothetical protein
MIRFSLRTRLAAAASLALLAAACGPQTPSASEAPTRAPVTEAEAQSALAAFGLETRGRASWAERRFENGGYVFTDFSLTDADGVIEAETLVLTGPRLAEAGPTFDAITLNSGEIRWPDGDSAFQMLTLTDPGPGLASNVARVLRGEESLTDAADDLSAYRFSDLTFTGFTSRIMGDDASTLNFSIGNLSAQAFDGDTLGAFILNDMDVTGQDADGGPLEASLDSFSMSGAPIGLLSGADFNSGGLGALAGVQPYEAMMVRGLAVTAGGAQIAMPELTGTTDTDADGVLRSEIAMPSLRLTPNAAHPQGAQMAMGLETLGYEAFELSFAGTSLYDPEADRAWTEGDNHFTLNDGVRIRFENELSGVMAYAQALEAAYETDTPTAQGGKPGGANKPGAALAATPPADALDALMIHRLLIAVEDQSLLERIMGAIAQTQGVSVSQARSQATAMTTMGLAMSGGSVPPTILNELSTALNAFLSRGGSLIIEMAPAEPVSAAVLNRPSTDAARLGLSIRQEGGQEPEPDAPAPK